MRNVLIAPQTEGKGRSFEAILLASVEADSLWSGGNAEITRPVWAMFAGSDPELRSFAANLQTGRKGIFGRSSGYRSKRDEKIEFLKSAGYQVTWQREAEGSLVTFFLPDIFRLDPGMVDPKGASFVCLPTLSWASAQRLDVALLIAHVRRTVVVDLPDEELCALAPLAFLFSAYLDRRTRCPLLSDGRFYLQLLLTCLAEGLASFPSTNDYWRDQAFGAHPQFKFRAESLADVGLVRPIAFRAGHEEIERVLSEQVDIFFKAVR